MPAITTIPLTRSDDTTIVVLKPRSITGDKATFVGDNSGTSAERVSASLSLSGSKSGRKSDQVNHRLDMPLVRLDAASASYVAGNAFVKIQFVLPNIMTDTERQDLNSMIEDLIQNALTKAYVDDLDAAY